MPYLTEKSYLIGNHLEENLKKWKGGNFHFFRTFMQVIVYYIELIQLYKMR